VELRIHCGEGSSRKNGEGAKQLHENMVSQPQRV
jgi:hypothetical protein